MNDLIHWSLCYLVHYQFEAIHPFSDGNGRVGEGVLSLMIYKWLGHTMAVAVHECVL